jgi:uncharacterized protein (TIGR03067 family)
VGVAGLCELFQVPELTSGPNDLEVLQGRWKQVAFDVDGSLLAYDAAGILCTFTGTRFVVHAPSGDILLFGSFRLDASADPKAVDWIDDCGPDAGKVLPAIYRFEENRFVFVAADEGMPRPRTFEAGPGLSRRIFVRCPK